MLVQVLRLVNTACKHRGRNAYNMNALLPDTCEGNHAQTPNGNMLPHVCTDKSICNNMSIHNDLHNGP